MKLNRLIVLIGALAALAFSGCGAHQPLPTLAYRGAAPMGSGTPVETRLELVEGAAIGHSLTTYALLPGGYALPIKSGPSPVTAFNADDQADFVKNLARVLTERGAIRVASADSPPEATITVKFLKTEHFPEMQDYVLDVLITARAGEKTYDRVHHISTIDQVNVVTRMFQHALDGRRRAAELLLASAVEELERWFSSDASAAAPEPATITVAMPFEQCFGEVARFLRERYARPSTFWKDGISVRTAPASESVAAIELRWSNVDGLPPFCQVDIYADGDSTRIVVRERDRLLVAKARVTEALKEFIAANAAGNFGADED
jgi:hypothetical protein